MRFHDAAHDREPQALAAHAAAVGTMPEAIEHMWEDVGGDASARVLHDEADSLRIALGAQGDSPTTIGELERVRHEVAEYLKEPLGIAPTVGKP
jgi:hypothetical protein